MTRFLRKLRRWVLVCGGLVGPTFLLAGAAKTPADPSNQSQAETRRTNKGRSNMKALDLTIKLNRTKFITGESLPIEVTLENRSQSAVAVPDPRVGSEFIYTMWSRTDPTVVHHLSADWAHADRYSEPPPRREFPGLQLAPGGRQAYNEDLARFEVKPIGPGEYTLVVGYKGAGDLTECAGVPVTIVPPHVVRMTTLAGVSESRVAVVFAQSLDVKHATVYQVENAAGRPGDGAAYPRREGLNIAELRGLAIASDVADNNGRRWLAWEEGGKIAAAVGQERYLSHLLAPVAHNLHASSLAPVGWQFANDDALFVALGAGAGGRAALVAASFSLSAPSTVKTIPVAGSAKPDAWVAQYQAGGGGAQLVLVTAEHAGHTVKVVRQTLALATGKADAPSTLVENTGPLAGMAIAPADGANNTDSVDVLFGPDPGTGNMSFLRLPLAGGRARANWDFLAPKNTGGKRPTAWALPRIPLDPPMVATHIGDKIYVRRGGGQWSVVVDGVPHVENLSLEAFEEGNVVAVWSDPSFGIRYHAVP